MSKWPFPGENFVCWYKAQYTKPIQTRSPMYSLFLYSYHPMYKNDFLLGSLYSRKNNTEHMTANTIFTITHQTANSPLIWMSIVVFPLMFFILLVSFTCTKAGRHFLTFLNYMCSHYTQSFSFLLSSWDETFPLFEVQFEWHHSFLFSLYYLVL